MSHLPVNHHLRPLYRVVAVLVAGWMLVFGAVSLGSTQGQPWFGQGDWSALGLSTNRAHAVFSLAVGALVLLAALVGRNFDRAVNLWVGTALLVVGTALLTLSRTEANLFNFTVLNTVVAYLAGMVLLAAGLYGRVDVARQGATRAARKPAAAEPAPAAGSAREKVTTAA